MRIIDTSKHTIESFTSHADADLRETLYNGMDSLLTHELYGKLLPKEGTPEEALYHYERALLPVTIGMTRRGIKVNQEKLEKLKSSLEERITKLEGLLNWLADLSWGKPLNPRSPIQLKTLLYTALQLQKQFKREGGESKVTTDEDALERLANISINGRLLCNTLLRIRSLDKQLGVLKTKLSPDGRWMASFNIAGTDTTRFSSSPDPFRQGANLQNITGGLRGIFIPDDDYYIGYSDLKGAESTFVAYMTGDPAYIKAADSGDSHTLIAAKIFGIPENKEEAEKPYSHGRSYRDVSKAAQHASNYLGTPYAIAVQKKIPRVLVENFQRNYFQEFPGIKEWQLKTIEALQTTGSLTTPTGARRVFWDRLSDDSTVKAAMAYLPQAGIAHVMNMGMIRMHYMVPECPLLAQVHDAVVFLIPKNNLDILRRVEEALVIPFAITDIKGVTRIVKIPVEINYGTSWHKKDMQLWEAS